ncbi:hypothetical protein [Terasakiella pusilla]|uniref:hypothetical protein n=1 Tax=Terasakiella pusilla TaxID=64973 RepID=UPI003AA96F16
MDWNITNTQYLIENTLNKDEVIKYLALNKGLCVSAQTLDCYMSNYQAFPRFISVYNPETLCREQRWLKADLQGWEAPKARRHRHKMQVLEQQLAEMRVNHYPRHS